jgi:hypothetical protein
VQRKLNVLGHVVGSGHIKPNPDNVSGILKLPVPKDVTMVRSFISAVGYYRDYIQNFALITAPMAQLLKKDVKWLWSEECRKAFEELKQRITSEPTSAFLTSPCLSF